MARVMEILAHLCSIANANFTPWDANPRLQAGILYLQMQILMCGRAHCTAQCTGQREISFSGNTHVGSASADTFLILHIFEKNSRTRILYDFSTKKSQFSMLKPKTVICGFLRGVKKA